MIVTDDGLQAVRQQLAIFEDDLVALRREFLPHDPVSFDILSEGHVAMIRKLRTDIETYLGLSTIDSAAVNEPVAIASGAVG